MCTKHKQICDTEGCLSSRPLRLAQAAEVSAFQHPVTRTAFWKPGGIVSQGPRVHRVPGTPKCSGCCRHWVHLALAQFGWLRGVPGSRIQTQVILGLIASLALMELVWKSNSECYRAFRL